MKKRVLSLILTLCAVLSLLGVPVSAAGAGGSMSNFAPIRAYAGQFSDVPAGAWYYNNVAALYELGLSEGRGDGTFGASSSDYVAASEILTFAARVRSLYFLGDPEAGPRAYGGDGGPWYLPYAAYLQAEGVIGSEFEGRYDRTVSRAQVAYVFTRILPETELPDRNGEVVDAGYGTHRYITDVPASSPYREDILDLYRWGILSGTDASGSFQPDSTITRVELAALLTRLADPSLRVTLPWDLSTMFSAKGTTWADLFRENSSLHTSHDPNDLAAIESNIRYMIKTGRDEITLNYTGSLDSLNNLADNYLNVGSKYPEFDQVAYGYSASGYRGRYTVTISHSSYSNRNASLSAAIAVHDKLWADGTITYSMTETEKARAYYTWICRNCSYGARDPNGYAAYGVFYNGLAVCQGYTAAYNMLLRLEGIDCYAIAQEDINHMWTAATLDGTFCHIDATWGDQEWYTEYEYFAMTPAHSAQVHARS